MVWLALKGYRPRHRNWRGGGGELDLVASRGDTIVFVEVKARRSGELGGAAGAVDRAKERALGRAAAAYLSRFGLWGRYAVRFDLVTLERTGGPLRWRLRHVPDAFRTDIGSAT